MRYDEPARRQAAAFGINAIGPIQGATTLTATNWQTLDIVTAANRDLIPCYDVTAANHAARFFKRSCCAAVAWLKSYMNLPRRHFLKYVAFGSATSIVAGKLWQRECWRIVKIYPAKTTRYSRCA